MFNGLLRAAPAAEENNNRKRSVKINQKTVITNVKMFINITRQSDENKLDDCKTTSKNLKRVKYSNHR